ncbi:MAG: sodium:proton antiporter NhaD [Bacteroidota bacterium]|nr:sodium:proton antiporter NhaD [Bacteroidota bacterium]
MAATIVIFFFVLGYLAIAFEHPLRLNKAASALITGVLCWTVYIVQSEDTHAVNEALVAHLGEISSILFFLMGAMTIVELIDSHGGFNIITRKITTRSTQKLLIIVTVLTFFLSSLLDNLTTTIVMISLCSRILQKKEERLWFAGMIIIAANAGGAWSPLGDVTTTMLWIGGQISAFNIMKILILPSLAVCVIPAFIVAFRFRGKSFTIPPAKESTIKEKREGKIILYLGVGLLIFVPFFKSLTDLPAFMGMLLSLGLIWVVIAFLHKKKAPEVVKQYSVAHALQRIDTQSILFFLGILLAVTALQAFGLLTFLASFLTNSLKNNYLIGTALGVLSAVVDNVPLVAASQGMFSLSAFPMDHPFWEFLALTTGTGGSAIIIGSAAGVAAMGIERVEFMWYLKKISWLALIGFASGILVYLLQLEFF